MNFAVILSGGVGNRLKGIDIPKQYYKVNDRMILSYCVETIEKSECIDAYIIAASKEWQKVIEEEVGQGKNLETGGSQKFLGFSAPGENRQISILNALWKLKDFAAEEDIVLIQDAVRPLASQNLIQVCLEAASKAQGAMPVLRMADTVYYSSDGIKIDSLLDRDKILAGQAPEAFVYGAYLRANEALTEDELLRINGSSEPAIKAGMKIVLAEGDAVNFKITTAEDLKRFEQLMRTGKS